MRWSSRHREGQQSNISYRVRFWLSIFRRMALWATNEGLSVKNRLTSILYCTALLGSQLFAGDKEADSAAKKEQSQFEAAVRELRIGDYYGYDILHDPQSHWISQGRSVGVDGRIVYRSWPDTTYCLYMVCGGSGSQNGMAIKFELYRLPPISTKEEGDFLDFLNGYNIKKPDFQYELIYSDPLTCFYTLLADLLPELYAKVGPKTAH
jgi:hypothetical protein